MKKLFTLLFLIFPILLHAQNWDSISTISSVNRADSVLIHKSDGYHKTKLGNFPFDSGSVTNVSVVAANGISATITNATTTPAITLTLGAITPLSVTSTGKLSASNFFESATSLRAGTSSLFNGTSQNTIYGQSSAGGNVGTCNFGYNNKINSASNSEFYFGANINTSTTAGGNRIIIGNSAAPVGSNQIILTTNPVVTTYNGQGFIGIGTQLSVTNATNALTGTFLGGYQASSLNSTINSVIIGPSAKAYVDPTFGVANGENITMGYQANSGSWKAIAIGGYAKALSVSSTAFGHTTYAIAAHCHVFGRGGYSDKGNSILLYNGSPSPTLYLGSIYASHTNPSIPGGETIDNSASLNAGTYTYNLKVSSGQDVKPVTTLTNVRGANLQINGGESTGTAEGGEIKFATTPASVTSSNIINNGIVAVKIDAIASGGAEQTRFFLLDLTTGTLKRVSFGANDSGGIGKKVLLVDN